MKSLAPADNMMLGKPRCFAEVQDRVASPTESAPRLVKQNMTLVTSPFTPGDVWTLTDYAPFIFLSGSVSRVCCSTWCFSAGCWHREPQSKAQEPRASPLPPPAVTARLVTGPRHAKHILYRTGSRSEEPAPCCATPRRSTSRRTATRLSWARLCLNRSSRTRALRRHRSSLQAK